MFIEKLTLTNFRCYESLSLDFSQGINFFTGLNGEGKTNIIEAISLLALGKSFVTSDEKECIEIFKDYTKVESIIDRGYPLRIEMIISQEGKKVSLNGKELNKLSEMSGNVYIVTFAPTDVNFYKGSTVNRRKFIDVSLSMLSPAYLSCISLFRRLLKDRNALLKQEVDFTLLKVIDEQIAPLEYEIVKMRTKFIKELNVSLKKVYEKLGIDTGIMNLEYLSVIPFVEDKKEFISKIIFQMKDDYANDIKRKSTTRGIHHEDIKFIFRGTDIALTGSQGQNRIASLALKIALANLIKEKYKEEPILLLDDVLSELDSTHQEALGNLLKDYKQVFLTGTEVPLNIKVDAEFVVSNHSVRRK